MTQRYAVRADHDKRVYEVYDVPTGATVESFTYKPRSELDRGRAAGRANLSRKERNEADYRAAEKARLAELRSHAPYPWCHHPEQCCKRGSCIREFSCGD